MKAAAINLWCAVQESGECLRHLTQQAVVLQKKMNDIYQVYLHPHLEGKKASFTAES
jgi:hypothetical protein